MSANAQPAALHAEANAALSKGDLPRALGLSTTAVSSLFRHRLAPAGQLNWGEVLEATLALDPDRATAIYPYVQQWGMLLVRTGMANQLVGRLPRLVDRLTEPGVASRLAPVHVAGVLALLGFSKNCPRAWSDTVFENFVLPWLLRAADDGDFPRAQALEMSLYIEYVMREESSEWFRTSTSRWASRLAAASRRHRPAAPHSRWLPEEVRRIALFLHNASMLAHVTVLLETLAGARRVGMRGYEFTVFVFAGRDRDLHRELTGAGVKVRYLHEGLSPHDYHGRLVRLERVLSEENFAALLWITQVTMMSLCFPRRMAPLQAWWSMKYHGFELEEIDARLGHENVVLEKMMDGHEWRTFGTASKSWIDPSQADAARVLRARFPADAIVAASIGREEKLDSPEFLDAVCEVMLADPRVIFLWTGRVERESIRGVFERRGVSDRARFIGWVDTRLYAQAIDLFLDSFPFPAGFTLKQAMAAGKPVVMMRSPESLETGVPGAISPVLEGTARAPAATLETLRTIFTRERDFDLYFCASTPGEYVALAASLVADARLRALAGAANRAYVETFMSSPDDEARKFLDHLDALFDTSPALAPCDDR